MTTRTLTELALTINDLSVEERGVVRALLDLPQYSLLPPPKAEKHPDWVHTDSHPKLTAQAAAGY